ncbi:MAG: L-lysine 6-transaminase [Planctomycetes bacterium]|nr:L-lysine 6-transaminase [Planctomycetota bacterium]
MTTAIQPGIAPDQVHDSLGKWILVDGYPFVLDLERSQGATLVDGRTGREFLDFFGCFGSTPIGWNHPALRNEEFLAKAANAVVNRPANSDLYTTEMAEFVQAMGEIAIPEPYKHMFFIDGGALAVENCIKVATDWKIRRNRAKGVQYDVGNKILHFEKAFHGRSGYTLSLTNTLPDKVDYFPKFQDWPRCVAPAIEFPITEEGLQKLIGEEACALAMIDAAFEKDGDDIAAILIETIQCEGGDRHFRPEFLQALQARCEKYDCLFIVDEVQTGFFGSGTPWAWQQYGIQPDLWAFGKKSQQCGIVAGPKVDLVPDNCFQKSSRINSTWGGNLVDMVRATRVLEVIRDEKLADNAAAQGKRWLEGMQQIADGDDRVSNVRGQGLIMAFDMPDGAQRNALLHKMMKHGLIGLSSGDRTVRFRPHLAITDADTDKCLELTAESLKAL